MFDRVVAAPSLFQAWRKVKANRGVAGIDAVSLCVFAERLEANLRELSRSLVSGNYQPLPARFVRVRKANGKERELAILAVRDRVAQRAVLDAIEPLIEPRLNDCCFAFRPQRSIEAAVERLVAARANGFVWTLESDVADFFGSIDRSLLTKDLRGVMSDARLLALIELWLEAGALDGKTDAERETMLTGGASEESFVDLKNESGGVMRRVGRFADRCQQHGRAGVANARLLLRETFDESVDSFIAEQLGADAAGLDEVAFNEIEAASETDYLAAAGDEASDEIERAAMRRKSLRRAGIKRLVRDGALVALSHRALLGRVVGAKMLGLGGLAAAAYFATPALRQLYLSRMAACAGARGTLQGAPVSPLLTNFYMTPFDDSLTKQGWRLIRYCDDFVISCRTEAEAREAWKAAAKTLKSRRLELHPDKTRIVAPGEAFEFLGYQFKADGSIVAPPSTPERLARSISRLSQRNFKRLVAEARRASEATGEGAGGAWRRLARLVNRRD